MAAHYGHTEIVNFLLEKGANIHQDNAGETPLYWAARWGHTEIVKLLLDAGANINQADKYGQYFKLLTRQKVGYKIK